MASIDRSALLAAVLFGVLSAVLAPLFPPTADLPWPLVSLVSALGALAGLWVVSHALALE